MYLVMVEFLLPLGHSSHLGSGIQECLVEGLREIGSIIRVGRTFLGCTVYNINRQLGLIAKHQKEWTVSSCWMCTAIVSHEHLGEVTLPLKGMLLNGCGQHV